MNWSISLSARSTAAWSSIILLYPNNCLISWVKKETGLITSPKPLSKDPQRLALPRRFPEPPTPTKPSPCCAHARQPGSQRLQSQRLSPTRAPLGPRSRCPLSLLFGATLLSHHASPSGLRTVKPSGPVFRQPRPKKRALSVLRLASGSRPGGLLA